MTSEAKDIYAIPSSEPGLVWYEFAQVVGPEELKRSFGWDTPPQQARAHEHVWRVFDEEQPRWQVGWLAIRRHPCDPTIGYLMRGVYPKARRQGYRVAMGEWAAQWGVGDGLKYLVIEILATNTEHLNRHIQEGRGVWVYSGVLNIPYPPTYVFVRTL